MKLCFISYARNSNLDGRLGRFVEKLRKQLPGYLPHGTKPDELIFFDVKNIENGDDWMGRLAEETRTCKLCLCFYSPPYFTSEYSGREVQVFLQRVKEWNNLPGNALTQARAIIPVVWVPHDPLPPIMNAFQFTSARLPAAYKDEGLFALATRKGRADAYNIVLNELTKQIAATSQTVDLPIGAAIAKFEAVDSAFHTATPLRYGAAALILVEPSERAQPFAPGGMSIDAMIEGVANRCRIGFREVRLVENVEMEILRSIGEREMPVVIASHSALASASNASLVRRVAAALDGSATVMIFSPPLPSAADAAEALRKVSANSLRSWTAAHGSAGLLVATDPATLDSALERRLQSARRELIMADPARRAQDANLEAAAQAQGILLDARPVLTGPGI
jgi:hypothetical protein